MAIWLYEVDIATVLQQCRDGDITVQEAAKGVAEALKEPRQKVVFSLPGEGIGWVKDNTQECASDFEYIAEDHCSTEDDFDEVLGHIYDVCDYEVKVTIKEKVLLPGFAG